MGLLDKLELRGKSDSESESLDDSEIEPLFTQDPEPGERPARKSGGKRSAPAPRSMSKASVAKMAREVAEDLTGLIEMGAAVWGMTDECCAPILEEQAKPIAESLTAILARNPRLLAKFADTDLVAYSVSAGMLFKALKPVAQSVYRNHVSRAVDDEQEGAPNGAVYLNSFPAYSGR